MVYGPLHLHVLILISHTADFFFSHLCVHVSRRFLFQRLTWQLDSFVKPDVLDAHVRGVGGLRRLGRNADPFAVDRRANLLKKSVLFTRASVVMAAGINV